MRNTVWGLSVTALAIMLGACTGETADNAVVPANGGECADGTVLVRSGSDWRCQAPAETHWDGVAGKPSGFEDGADGDVLAGLTCAGGQVAKWDASASAWLCATDLAGSDLGAFQLDAFGTGDATYMGGNVGIGVVAPSNTLDVAGTVSATSFVGDGSGLTGVIALSCPAGEVAQSTGTAWTCAADATLSETAVDGFVANNGYLTSEADPAFSASPAAGIGAADVAAWNGALSAFNAGLEILDVNDSRVTFTGSWTDALDSWGTNRLTRHARYTACSGVGTDCSANWITLDLQNNQHRSVTISHLDWSNTDRIDVYLTIGGGMESFHRSIFTAGQGPATPYTSQFHNLASNLPLGMDVVLRVEAALGRLHFEGFALSQRPLPLTIAPKTNFTASNSNVWGPSDLNHTLELTEPTVVDVDYLMGGSGGVTHFLTRLRITRPDRTEYPVVGRMIVGNTAFFSNTGNHSVVLDAGTYTFEVEYRTPGPKIINPNGTDYQNRYIRFRFPAY